MPRSVLVLVSGGVDSCVASYLLKEKGLDVAGLFLRMTGTSEEEASLNRAARILDLLRVDLHVKDVREQFKKEIIDYFEKSYLAGLTPNCCCICNWKIKVVTALEFAQSHGHDLIATGHYARIQTGKGPLLLTGRDSKKDQSYFLHQIKSWALERMILPLGDMRKDDVKKIAKDLGFYRFIQGESQDICFFKGDYRAFFRMGNTSYCRPGPIVTKDGRILGTHRGICNYTVGQRRGLGIPDSTPFYVIEIKASENSIVVGKQEDLFQREVVVQDVNWLLEPLRDGSMDFDVKIRSRHKAAPARVKILGNDIKQVKVVFSKPQRAVTPGQFAVFYKGQAVAGGGQICA